MMEERGSRERMLEHHVRMHACTVCNPIIPAWLHLYWLGRAFACMHICCMQTSQICTGYIDSSWRACMHSAMLLSHI